MKRLIAAAGLLLAGHILARAATDVIEQPIAGHSDPVAVAVSTYAYTNVTSASTRIRYMSAVIVDNPSTNNASMHGHVGDCSSTSVSTSAVKGPIEIAPSSNGGYILLAEDECLWLVSRYTVASESATVQGVRQRR